MIDDPGSLADTILRCVGPGPILDVGCGDGALVHALLARGIDARGIDASAAAIARAGATAPDRFSVADAARLPFPDGAFAAVVSTFCLDTVPQDSLLPALRELRRVTTGAVFLMVRAEKSAAGEVRSPGDRATWESRLFEAGFRRHPLLQRITPYAALETERSTVSLLMQPMSEDLLRRYPSTWLAANRLLHTDMLRESGRRSDAHIARYALACDHARPNDVVLDAACGLGYGAAILAAGSEAARIIGVDNSVAAIAYARDNFTASGAPTEFHESDAANLAFLPDESVDLVVSFETLEHVADPAALLKEFRRVLTPGGRVIVSVPNDWTDETGKDPNPHHIHVYTWERLRDQLAAEFMPERRWRQVAGGAAKLSDRPRSLDEVTLGAPFDAPHPEPRKPSPEPEAEWWLALGMKSPIGADKRNYRETLFPTYGDAEGNGPDGFHLSAFARDYDNPWLFRSLICIGPRMSHDAQRDRLAREVIAAARPGSPDRGGAICVLAYNVLASPTAERIAEALSLIEDFDAAADTSAHAWRWRISNRYAAARLLLLRGDRAAAREHFLRCGEMDVLRFSPLLATKTIDAFRHAGVISIADGDAAAAREAFQRGLEESRRVVQGSWINIWGRPDRPQPYGMHEIAQVMDLGSRCASWLGVLDRVGAQPGQAWLLAQRQSFAEMLSWTLSLQRNGRWLEEQRGNWERIAAERLAELSRLKSWADGLSLALSGSENELAAARTRTGELEAWNAQLTEAAAWQRSQREATERINADLTAELTKVRGWADELKAAAAWHQQQLTGLEQSLATASAELTKARAWADELKAAVAWHEGHKATIEHSLATTTAELQKARAWAADRAAAVAWQEEQRVRLDQALDAANAERLKTAAWTQELTAALAWQKEQTANWESAASRQAATLEEATRWGNEMRASHDRLSAELLEVRQRHAETELARRELADRLAQAESRITAISEELRKLDESRNIILGEKSRLSAELGRMTMLPVHRFAIERWRNQRNRSSPEQNSTATPPPPAS